MSDSSELAGVRDLTAEPTKVTEFWMTVDRREPDGCWPWTGYTEDGYGRFYVAGRMIGSHELALTFTTGERRLPDLDTCHSCGNSLCCNPRHLRFDTRQSNVDDTIAMGRNHKFPQRLTDEQIRLMRRRRQAGAAQDHLAAQFGCSPSYVSAVINGKARVEAGGPIATNREYRRAI